MLILGLCSQPIEKKGLHDDHTQDSAGSSGWTHDNVSSAASVHSATSAIPYHHEEKPRTSTDEPGTAL